MNLIENVECFKNCTKLCKPHESNKAMWDIKQKLDDKVMTKEELIKQSDDIKNNLKHHEFI